MKRLLEGFGFAAQAEVTRWETKPATTDSKNLLATLVLVLFLALICFNLTGCGSAGNSVPVAGPTDLHLDPNFPQTPQWTTNGLAFQAYGCPMCPLTGENGEGQQPLVPGALTQFIAYWVYYGDLQTYYADKSSWHPTKAGLYYVDAQVWIEGTFDQQFVTYNIELKLSDAPQLWYSNTYEVPQGQPVRQHININTLMCMNGTTDHAEVFVSVSSGTNVRIRNEESQFEGYYVGPCGHN